jgi:hypothetical protein
MTTSRKTNRDHAKKKQRPMVFTLSRFEKIWIVDGSTLEGLFRKLQSLESAQRGQLAGKMSTVIDLMTRLPVEIWFEENPKASDTKLEENILNIVTENTLLY